MQAAKGLGFPIVVAAHVEAGQLPRETASTDSEEIAAHLEEQQWLLFVGYTRAMRHLFITYDRQLPLPFLTDLTPTHWQRV